MPRDSAGLRIQRRLRGILGWTHPHATIAAAAAVAVLGMLPSRAPAAPLDAASTSQFVQADYALLRHARAHLRAAEAVSRGLLAQVQRECPHAAAESPQNGDSTQLSNEVIGAMLLSAYHLDLPALRSFVGVASHLRWSNPRLTRTVHGYASALSTLTKLAPPHVCADVEAWVASGYQALPAATIAFDHVFLHAWVSIGLHPAGLDAFAGPGQRSLLRRSDALVAQLYAGEVRASGIWGEIIDELGVLP